MKTRNNKQYLVESTSFNNKYYKDVTNDSKYKKLSESINKNYKVNLDNVKKLNESIDPNISQKVIQNLNEHGLKTPRLWQFPISKINDIDHPNLNGRVYNRKLWENVINNQADIWKGGTGLANHPADDEDGDFMNQSIVWLDGFLGDDDIVYGIGALVGDGGALAQEIIDVGGRVGFSTAGFGDLLANNVVDPDTYEIDRFADLVLNPSQGVYGNSEDDIGKKNMVGENMIKEDVNKTTENEEVKKNINESVELKEDESTDNSTETTDTDTEDTNTEDTSTEITSESDESSSETDSTEDVSEDTGDTLSEQLISKHYQKRIDEISKMSGREWQTKVQKLENLVDILKKENLSENTKKIINTKITNLIEAIMKETESVINMGYDAKDLCEDIGISDINLLKGVQTKLEDFVSLEECLTKTKKEADKYKKLYEDKLDKLEDTVKDSYNLETSRDRYKNMFLKLSEDFKKTKKEFEENTENLERSLNIMKKRNNILLSKNEKLKELLDETNRTNSILESKLLKNKKVLSDYQTKENRIKEEQRKFREATTDISKNYDWDSDLFKEDGIDEYLESIDSNIDSKGLKTIQEAETATLFKDADDVLNEQAERTYKRINNNKGPSVKSLSELFD